MDDTKNIIFFDGVCKLCNSVVRFITRNDRKKKFDFMPLQSEDSRNYLEASGIDVEKINSVVLQSNGRFYFRSDAVLRVFRLLGFPWASLYVFIIVPRFIRDFFYKLIAVTRHRIFGTEKNCTVCP